jgi:hypothetical protein
MESLQRREQMISVDRILQLQFSAIPNEVPLVIQDCRLAPEWPSLLSF